MITLFTLFLVLFILSGLFHLAFKLTGAVLKAFLWLFLFLPMGIMLLGIGVVCCCTLILIPVGVALFKIGAKAIIPGTV